MKANYERVKSGLRSEEVTEQLKKLYGNSDAVLNTQMQRYEKMLSRHESVFNTDATISVISAPGRMEIGGNHTDHNHGLVLAASASLDTMAIVSPGTGMLVEVRSEGYPEIQLDLSNLSKRQSEEGTTTALIRGVASRMKELGYNIGGFQATIHSTVVSGSGLSSSAAFEVLVVAIFDHLFNSGNLDFKLCAQIGQYAENVYFGKPSGLLDQMASAAGGLVAVDFCSDTPEVTRMDFDFAEKGYQIVVVNTHGSHADLTQDYAAIPKEMKEVAAFFNQSFLRDVQEADFRAALPCLRKKVSDRSILRALHFYQENHRVEKETEALANQNLTAFFDAIIESGRSSFMYLQNVYAHPNEQGLSIALALAEELLRGTGAWRVHGGGFAGTTLNFVPDTLVDRFVQTMDSVFGSQSCYILKIRPEGAVKLLLPE